MMDSVETPFNECIKLLTSKMELDPGFRDFYFWARENNVPIVVLSSGMIPLIKALLDSLLHQNAYDGLTIVANDVESRNGKDINSEGGWQLKYRDDR